MAETVFNQQTVLEMNLDKSSMARTAKSIADSVGRAFSKIRLGGGNRGGAGAPAVAVGTPAAAAGGKGILNSLGKIIKLLGPIAIIGMLIGELLQFITPIFKLLSLALIMFLIPVFKLFKPFLRDIPTKFEGMLKFLGGILEGIQEFVSAFLKDPLGAIGELLDKVVIPAIGDVFSTLFEWGQKAVDWFIENAPQIFQDMLDLGSKIIDWFVENMPGIFEKVLEIGDKIFDWFVENAPEIFKTTLEIGAKILMWIVENLPKILGVLLTIGIKLVGWIVEKLPIILGLLLTLGKILLDWVIEKIGQILGKLLELGGELLEAILKKIKDGLGALADLGKRIFDAIMGVVTGGVIGLGGLVGGGVKTAGDVLGGIASVFNPFDDFIWRKGQEPIRINPQDSLIGMKDLKGLGGGGQTVLEYKPTYTVSGLDKEGFRRILEEVNDKNKTEFLGRLSYVSNIRA